MAGQIVPKDPNFPVLEQLMLKNKNRRTKEEVFNLFVKAIAPQEPTFTLRQFINWTRNWTETDRQIAAAQSQEVELIEAQRAVTVVQMESKLRNVADSLLDEAADIMEEHKENGVPLKERYFAAKIADSIWGKILKEKELAIKHHAEKRQTAGMFANLLRGAMSGEFTMADIEAMRQSQETKKEEHATTEPAGITG